jgi:hypothetical protein
MDGRAFLKVAQALAQGVTEADWRSAANRAYYALMLEAREALLRWGFPLPHRDQVHSFVRLRFITANDRDLKAIGQALEELGRLRNMADYQLGYFVRFRSAGTAQQSVQDARTAIALLDTCEADPVRRAAAIAAIRGTLPP